MVNSSFSFWNFLKISFLNIFNSWLAEVADSGPPTERANCTGKLNKTMKRK